jgi:hypothetical protein
LQAAGLACAAAHRGFFQLFFSVFLLIFAAKPA